MNCLPIFKPISKRFKIIGRDLRKMFSANYIVSTKASPLWKRLRNDDNKENVPIDLNTSPYIPSSLSDCENQLSFMDPNQLNPSAIPYAFSDNLNLLSPISPISSGYGDSMMMTPPNNAEFNVYNDQLSSSFDSLLKPMQSYLKEDSSASSTTSSIPYSPLSSFNFAEVRNLPSAFFSEFDFDFSSPTTSVKINPFHDELRRDFEMNGRTIELDETSFSPSLSSTPMLHRRWRNSNELYQQPDHLPREREQMSYNPSKVWMRSNRNFQEKKRKFKPNKKSLDDHCVFCKNNGMDEKIYRTHTVKDAMGRVLCPKLRQYKCPICGEDGDKSHTIKYCPKKPIVTEEDIQKMEKMSF